MKFIKSFFETYRLYTILIFGIIAIIADYLLQDNIEIIAMDFFISNIISDTEKLPKCIHYCVLGLFLYLSFCHLRQRRYAVLTGGRNYLSDNQKYKKTYTWLVTYFKENLNNKVDVRRLPIAKWNETEGVILGKVGSRIIHRPSSKDGNFCIFGLPGSGKTASIIIPSCIRFAGSVFCIDIKGDIEQAVTKYTKGKRKIKCFNPENPSGLHFDILAGVDTMSPAELELLVKSICDIVLPIPPNSRDTYFLPGGRNLFCGITLFLLSKDRHIEFAEIIRQILAGNAVDWITRIKESDCEIAQSYTNGLFGQKIEDVSGCYSHCTEAVKNAFAIGDMLNLFKHSKNCISPKDLEAGFDVYLRIPQDKISVYAPITSIITDVFMKYFMRKQDSGTGARPRPIIMILDEISQQRLSFETLNAALATLRSKGVTVMLAAQSPGQIEDKYTHQGLKSIIDSCRYIVILSVKDPQSARYFQEIIGKEKILNVSVSKSKTGDHVSRTISEGYDYIYDTEELQRLGDHVLIQYDGKYIEAEKTFYFK